MKLPKTVIINCKTYKVKVADINGGTFDTGKKLITIGKYFTNEEKQEILLHEIFETILVENNARYKLDYFETLNSHYQFFFNHEKFDKIIVDLRFALKDILK
jgi:hypothetical protein